MPKLRLSAPPTAYAAPSISLNGERAVNAGHQPFTRRVAHADHPFAWLIIACTLIGMLLAAADGTIVTAAMPKIISDLSGFNQYAWVTTAYLLGLTVTMPLYGKLADLYEAKWVFLFGLLLFVLASALCGLAHSMAWLIVCRTLQGIGAGALSPVSIVIMSAFVTPERRAGVQGSASGIFLMATIAGPIIGGWLTDHGTWRWVFYINVPAGLVVAAVLAALLPRLRVRHEKVQIDYLGAVLLILTVVPLLILLGTPPRERSTFSGPVIAGLVVVAGAVLVLFVRHELRHPEPIVDPRFMTIRLFAVSSSTIMLLSAVTFASLVYIPLYVQGVLGRSATNGGLVLAPLMLSSISGRLITNWLNKHQGRLRPLTLGCLGLVVVGAAILYVVRPGSGLTGIAVVVAMALLGAGLGASNMFIFTAALSPFGKTQFGQATGTVLFLRSLGGAIITSLLGGILAAQYAATLDGRFPWLRHARLAAQLDDPRLLLIHPSALRSGHHPLLAALRGAMRLALAAGLRDVFAAVLAMAALAFVIMVIFPVRATRQAAEAAAMAEGGAGALGKVLPAVPEPARTPETRLANTVWDLMCLILYWRHGTPALLSGSSSRRTFNSFEEGIALPSSLRDPDLARIFAQAWPLVRARTALDRYRAEAIVDLLDRVRHLPGDVAVCGGTGDGLAALLILVIHNLKLGKRVFVFGDPDGADSLQRNNGHRAAARDDAGALDTFVRAHGLSDVVVRTSDHLGPGLAALRPGQSFCLIHIDYASYAETVACLRQLLPVAALGAAIIIGHYHNSYDGARRAIQEQLPTAHLCVGPLPQVHFFATMPDDSGSGTDWGELQTNRPYADFLQWVQMEMEACFAAPNDALRERQIVRSVGKLGLAGPAAAYLDHFVAMLREAPASSGWETS